MRRLAPLLLLLLAARSAVAGPEASFSADFRRDPSRQGFVVQGEDDGRFAWVRGRDLRVALDSNADAARFVAPLGLTLTDQDSFRIEAELTIVSLEASPEDFFQLAFGPCNAATTGLNRTGTALPGPPFFVDDSDVYDNIEIAYYPNVTFFGGPFLQPAVFGAERGSPFAHFAANFGPSADLGDNGPGEIRELPAGRRLRFVAEHDACRRLLTTRVFDVTDGGATELATGLLPVDLSGLDASGAFTLDAFGIHAYRDLADFDPSTRSLAMDVRFHGASVERLPAVTARTLPRALNAGARAPARLLVQGADAASEVVLVESGGVAVSVPLATAAHPGGLVAEIPRELARPPLAVAIDGCVVPVAGPVVVPR